MITNCRWGIIAPGRIAHNFAKSMSVVEGSTILAVASRNADRCRQFALDYGIPRQYASYEKLIADPDIDAIYIANPHAFHAETAALCLDAGKPVLCEKPITLNHKQAVNLFELSNRTNTLLMEAMWTKFLPAWRQVYQWISDKKIGDIQLIQSNFGFKAKFDIDDRLFNRALGGGSLLDIGIYNIALGQSLFKSPPDAIQADVLIGSTGVDERVSAEIRYGSAVNQFTCTVLTDTKNDMTIYGTEGSIYIDDPFHAAQRIQIKTNELNDTLTLPFESAGFEYQIRAFENAIQQSKKECAEHTTNDTLINIKTVDSILLDAGIAY